MASSSAAAPLAALLLFFISAVAAAPLEQLCASLGGFYVTPEACTSSLCANDGSSCRSARGAPELAALAAGLAAANATAAKASLEAALGSPGPAPLRSCLRLYAGAAPALEWAARAVAAGRYPGATAVLEAARYVASACAGVADGGAAELPAENEAFGVMANVAHAVVASVSSSPAS